MLIFEGKEIETDTEGYLKESSQWSEPLAVMIAFLSGIQYFSGDSYAGKSDGE